MMLDIKKSNRGVLHKSQALRGQRDSNSLNGGQSSDEHHQQQSKQLAQISGRINSRRVNFKTPKFVSSLQHSRLGLAGKGHLPVAPSRLSSQQSGRITAAVPPSTTNNTPTPNTPGVITNSASNTNTTNPVRAANQKFFLVSTYKDPSFLKEECALAHAQVALNSTSNSSQSKQSVRQPLLKRTKVIGVAVSGSRTAAAATATTTRATKTTTAAATKTGSAAPTINASEDYKNNNSSSSYNYSISNNRGINSVIEVGPPPTSLVSKFNLKTTATGTGIAGTTAASTALQPASAATLHGMRRTALLNGNNQAGGVTAAATTTTPTIITGTSPIRGAAATTTTTNKSGTTTGGGGGTAAAAAATTGSGANGISVGIINTANGTVHKVVEGSGSGSGKYSALGSGRISRLRASATGTATTTTTTPTVLAWHSSQQLQLHSHSGIGATNVTQPNGANTGSNNTTTGGRLAANSQAASHSLHGKLKPLFGSSHNNNSNNNNNNNINNTTVSNSLRNSFAMNNNNNNINNNSNNNLQQQQQQQQQQTEKSTVAQQLQQQHDDITYIDSDETPPATQTTTTPAASAAGAVEKAAQGGGSVGHFKPVTPPLQVRIAKLGQVGGDKGSSVSGARGRPRSTIISTSTNSNFAASYEKFNNYLLTNGEREVAVGSGIGVANTSVGGAGGLSNALTGNNAAVSNARRFGIDSVSIKASIEKFNNLTIEQKRLPSSQRSALHTKSAATASLATASGAQHTAAGGTGAATSALGTANNSSSSISNLQQRFNTELDSAVRMTAGYSSSLTRAGYRTSNQSNHCSSMGRSGGGGGGSSASGSNRSGSLIIPLGNSTLSNANVNANAAAASATATAVVAPISKSACRALSTRIANGSTILGASNKVKQQLNDSTANTLDSLYATSSTTSASTTTTTTTTLAATTTTSSTTTTSAAAATTTTTAAATGGSASSGCGSASSSASSTSTPSDCARSTAGATRSFLPPVSPTSSRYWDKESSRNSNSSSASSALSSTTKHNIDDGYKNSREEKFEGLCGLRNIGNTCFMNSVIQCLSHTTELTRFLRSHHGTRSASTKDQQILHEFAKLIQEMWTVNVHSVTPMELKRAFSTKHRMYSDYNQQDAQEFLRFFLDSLHSALNTGVKGETLNIDDNLSDNKKADLTWEWYTRHENSLIRDLFVGQLKSTLRCTTCGNTSVTFDPFWDLSVPLPSSSRCKLEACLDLFIREEILDGDEMPTCSKCKTRRKCTKSFTIQRFPKYLVIHLKRFSETRWSKLSNIVEFPTTDRGLNMGPYGANLNSNVHYSLYAISNHMGSTAGGHYVALCKHPVSRKWHEFNDNIVSDSLHENYLVSSSAYILFYERA